MKKFLGLLLLLISLTLPACTRKVGWVETNIGNTFSARYRLFDGMQTDIIRLETGESVILAYDIEVLEGSVTLQITDPNRDHVWESKFTQNEKGELEFTSEMDGRYQINIIGEETEGSFDLQWEIVDQNN
jgi:hypothetical protein